MYCKICGEPNCKKHSFFLNKSVFIDKISGSSPPEIFVGKWGYPNVYAGVLAPQEYGDTEILSSPELWHEKKMPIKAVLSLRNKLVYGRKITNIKNPFINNKIMPVIQEVAMAYKSIASELHLKKSIEKHEENDQKTPLISNAAEVKSIRLQENSKIKPKVDYLVNDSIKSKIAILELDKAGIPATSISKILSAGLLGLKSNRTLVPSRWSITAIDSLLSKEKLKKIKTLPEISEITLFNAEYVGNHYEFILLPEKFTFEVIEISLKNFGVWQDYETFFARKTYARDVTGAYYVNRLALTEYLLKIKRQAHCLVFREVREEYTAPLGVGILREISREAFKKQPEKFNTLNEAFQAAQKRLKMNISNFTDRSITLANYGTQKKLSQFT